MITITKEEAIQFIIKNEHLMTQPKKIGARMTVREFKENGWEYTLFFINDDIKKIEEYNHRELIEVFVK